MTKKDRGMRIGEVARLTGLSLRTLRYYDEIDVLRPDGFSEAGYRLYSEKNLSDLQQILFFREIGMRLEKIRAGMSRPGFDRIAELELQRKVMLARKNRVERILALIDRTIEANKGGITMSGEQMFEGFDFTHNPYEKEARERWGDAAVDEADRRIRSVSAQERSRMSDESAKMMQKLSELRGLPPDSPEAQRAIGEWSAIPDMKGGFPPFISGIA